MRPHDLSDLYFAPVVLAVDARLRELGALPPDELRERIALAGDRPADSYEDRRTGVLSAATELIELHHWQTDLEARGLRLFHEDHALVLGLPDTIRDYLAGS